MAVLGAFFCQHFSHIWTIHRVNPRIHLECWLDDCEDMKLVVSSSNSLWNSLLLHILYILCIYNIYIYKFKYIKIQRHGNNV